MSNKKIILKITIVAVVILVLAETFELGFRTGQKTPAPSELTDPSTSSTINLNTFWQTWDTINKKYLRAGEINNQKKVYGAIGGLVHSLGDPYSEFFEPTDSQKFEEDIQGNFGGIGAEIGIKNDQIIIVSPLEGTPASRAGLKPQDAILKINSTSTLGLTVEEAVKFIRGKTGTKVFLTILRSDWDKPQDIPLIRETITVPTLDYKMKDDDIAYISLHSFNANAVNLFYEAMVKALSHGSQGMILDLRNNPGGYLQVSIDLAGWFLNRGDLVVSEASRNNKSKEFYARGNSALKDFPVVILTNNGSASASEILAGTLRDNRNIKIVGEKTFGKGTVQELETMEDGSSLKLTVAHWILPKGETIDGKGLLPDFEVKLTDEDTKNKKDPQLDKAIEVLKKEIQKNQFTLFKLE